MQPKSLSPNGNYAFPTGFLLTVPVPEVSTILGCSCCACELLTFIGLGPVIFLTGDRILTLCADMTCGSGEGVIWTNR
jgi:hypothetical protein